MDPSKQKSETGGLLIDFNLSEARDALNALSLSSVVLDGHLVVFKSGFDLTISGEPYLALMFLFSIESGDYYARIWNQTVRGGTAESAEEVVAACRGHFGGGPPCIGCPESEEGDRAAGREYLVSQTPIPRKISLGCRGLLGEDADGVQCAECVKLRDDTDDGGGVTGSPVKMVKEGVCQSEPIDLISDDEQQDPEEIGQGEGKEEDCQKRSEVLASEEKEIDEAIKNLTSSVKLPKEKGKVDEKADPSGPHEKEKDESGDKGDPGESPDLASASEKQQEDEPLITHEVFDLGLGYTYTMKAKGLGLITRPSRGQESSFLCRTCKTSYNGSEKHVCALRTPYLCTLCFKAFRSESSLKLHRSSVHDVEVKSKPRRPSKQGWLVRADEDDADQTDKSIVPTVDNRRRDFACDHCEYKATQQVVLNRHVKAIHDKIRDFVCRYCGYTASLKGTLRVHVKRRHANVAISSEEEEAAEEVGGVKEDPPVDETDYASIIEEALSGDGTKALSLEKINAYVEGHPKADVKRYPKWKESVRQTLSANYRFSVVPVRKAFILPTRQGYKPFHKMDSFWRLRCDDKKDEEPEARGPILPPGHKGRAGAFKCKGCGRECQHALELIDHMRAEDHMADPSVRCPSCANQVRRRFHRMSIYAAGQKTWSKVA